MSGAGFSHEYPMIFDVQDDACRASQLRGNSYHSQYAAEREAMLLNLRHRFRSVRRVLVTFASGQRYVERQRTFTAAAAATGEFHTIESWSFDLIKATPFFDQNRDILQQSRGQGYWLWKPYLIWCALEASQDGDLIVYNDCLPEDGNVLGHSILPMLSWLSGGDRRIAISRKPAPNRLWTKRDCFHYMGCDASRYWDEEQVIATYLGFIAGPETRNLVSEWLEFCRDARILTDAPNTCELENLSGFKEHRHDQSVLSNLLIRNGFTLPAVRFGENIFTKHFQEMLGLFETGLVKERLSARCISTGKMWRQSSASVWSPDHGVMDNTVEDRDFFFHTDDEERPWWNLDLGTLHLIERIEILNRPEPRFAWRANRLQLYVGQTDDDFQLVFDAVSAEWDAITPLVVNVANEAARYVKVMVDATVPLHLKSVRVYGFRLDNRAAEL